MEIATADLLEQTLRTREPIAPALHGFVAADAAAVEAPRADLNEFVLAKTTKHEKTESHCFCWFLKTHAHFHMRNARTHLWRVALPTRVFSPAHHASGNVVERLRANRARMFNARGDRGFVNVQVLDQRIFRRHASTD